LPPFPPTLLPPLPPAPTVAVPPGLTPPLDVEEVPGGVGLVADELVLLLVEVLLDVDVGVLVDVLVVGVELVVGVDVVVLVVLVLAQSRAARWATVLAPWLRFCDRVVLIVAGRLVTALVSAAAALLACAHWWASTAEETEFSWLVRLLF
jgi:hypothetical protein